MILFAIKYDRASKFSLETYYSQGTSPTVSGGSRDTAEKVLAAAGRERLCPCADWRSRSIQSINCVFYAFSFGEIPTAPQGAGCQPPAGPCPNSKYRTIDGSCNNLRYTNWGIPNSKYARLLPPKYSDGKNTSVVNTKPYVYTRYRLTWQLLFEISKIYEYNIYVYYRYRYL